MSRPNTFTIDLYERESATSSKKCTECGKRLAGLKKLKDWDICRDCDQKIVNADKKFIYDKPTKQTELDESELEIAREQERLAEIEKINKKFAKKTEETVEIKDKPLREPLVINKCENCGGDIPKRKYESRMRYRGRRFCSQPCTKSYFRANAVGWYAHGAMSINAKKKKVIEKKESLKLMPVIWSKRELNEFSEKYPELAGF